MKRRRVRRRAPRAKRLFWLSLALGAVAYVYGPRLNHILHLRSVQHALDLTAVTLLLGATWWITRRIRRALRLRARLRRVEVSDRRADYLIDKSDYTRGLPKEHVYRRAMQLTLLATFDNRCAKCGARDDGVDLDHFFLPKNAGGCFIMRHAEGHLVNNAVPLCVGCNRSKSDRSYRKFFSRPQLAVILEKNAVMTRLLNQSRPLDHRGEPNQRRPRAA